IEVLPLQKQTRELRASRPARGMEQGGVGEGIVIGVVLEEAVRVEVDVGVRIAVEDMHRALKPAPKQVVHDAHDRMPLVLLGEYLLEIFAILVGHRRVPAKNSDVITHRKEIN
ncbi:MAG: hypothetical protein ACYCPS_06290, partial [Candidatus Saccharimonadales bacterium]